MNGPIAWYHQRFIHRRRVEVLSQRFAQWIHPNASVLDIGCGDGLLDQAIASQRHDLTLSGIDVMARPNAAIPVTIFDGLSIPMDSDSVDTVIMVDVLHHAEDAETLLREAKRVARRQIIIKDHYLQGWAAKRTLMFMDHVGNSRHGVAIPCHYLTPDQWDSLYRAANVNVRQVQDQLGIYPIPFSWCFERSLHFMVELDPA